MIHHWNRLIRRASSQGADKRVLLFAAILLLIEFLDELVFGVREAAWPLIRTDLTLSYSQIGLLLGVPGIVGNLIELPLGVLGDVWKRRALVLGGGIVFALALLLTGVASSFVVLLLSFTLFYPASGAFVSLSQATLMDLDPSRHEQNMARWTVAGSLGVLAGPLLLGAAVWAGGGWRVVFALLALASVALVALAWRQPFPAQQAEEAPESLRAGLVGAMRALGRRDVLRWLVLLLFMDFMLDILLGFLALYFVDVVGVTALLAGSTIVIWTGVGLLGDVLLIPLLERVRGLTYLRYSAAITFVLFSAFLLAPTFGVKVVLLALLGVANAGWYAILQGQLYSALPGQSGTVITISSAFGILNGLMPSLLGFIAEQVGLGAMMWVLLLGPIALLVGIPRTAEGEKGREGEGEKRQ